MGLHWLIEDTVDPFSILFSVSRSHRIVWETIVHVTFVEVHILEIRLNIVKFLTALELVTLEIAIRRVTDVET